MFLSYVKDDEVKAYKAHKKYSKNFLFADNRNNFQYKILLFIPDCSYRNKAPGLDRQTHVRTRESSQSSSRAQAGQISTMGNKGGKCVLTDSIVENISTTSGLGNLVFFMVLC